jgi:transcriptional regulator with GAF, ATPase, and Fis domain
VSDDRPTEGKLAVASARPTARPGYALLVLGADTATLFTLPREGEVTIGRSDGCDLRIQDPRLSRVHAIVSRSGEGIRIVDNDSLNGVVVGGERLAPGVPRELQIGDEIALGGSQIVVQYSAGRSKRHRLWPHGYFEARLAHECACATAEGRQFAVVRVRAEPDAQTAAVEAALADVMRATDLLGAYADRDYEMLLVNYSPDDARKAVESIRARLEVDQVPADVAVACFPNDGHTAESLIARCAPAAPAATTDHDVVRSGALARLDPLVAKVGAGNISVLVLGETGVGKEVLARRIHDASPRAKKPMVCLNCASLSESLLESELFGHEKGAFTGAVSAKVGLLEAAGGGTAFLDEIGEMPLTLQAKLLRVLEQREIVRVGSVTPRAIDVRFVSATNRDLEAEIARGRFRQDLYYRLNGFTIVLPPLRERTDEIEPLAVHFLRAACKAAGRKPLDITPDALRLLVGYDWPGNIRELRNVMERAVLLCSGRTIAPEHFPLEKMGRVVSAAPEPPPPSRSFRPRADAAPGWNQELETTVSLKGDAGRPTIPPAPPTLESLGSSPVAPPAVLRAEPYQRVTDDAAERRRILEALEKCAWNQTAAAKMLGIARQTLVTRMELYNMPRPRKKA